MTMATVFKSSELDLEMNNCDVLQAMNKVVVDVRQSGILAGKFIRKKDPESFNLLLGLIAAAFSDED
jgi:hypothetical protein